MAQRNHRKRDRAPLSVPCPPERERAGMGGDVNRSFSPCRDDRGQVHILFIFGALALACVAFLVFNTGELAARRIRLQNGADAAGHAAASWTARGLNLISANNVAMTQLIAMIVHIDSLDVYCDMATPIAKVQQAACERLKWANWPPIIYDGYRWSQRAVREERFLEILGEVVDEMVATYHPTEPDDPSSLWQMLYMLEEFNEAVVEVTPVMSAERAVVMGKTHGAHRAFAWPYWSPLPVEKAEWQALQLPTDLGSRCPGPVRPKFGYHDLLGYHWNEGPLRHLRRAVIYMLGAGGGHWPHNDWTSDNASINYINYTNISNTKFALLFNGRRGTTYKYEKQYSTWPPPPPAEKSVWCDEDMHALDQHPDLVCLPVGTKYPDYVHGQPAPPIVTRWHLVKRGNPLRLHSTQARDWRPGGSYRAVPGTENTWEEFRPFTTDIYPEFNIGNWTQDERETGDMTTIWHHRRFIYRYSKRTAEMDFENPIYGRSELPRPHVLNSSWDGMTEARMKDEWSWLGFCWRSGRAKVWPKWFVNTVPGGQMIAVARARLYNPTSWDMFTQDWRVMMIPVGRMDDWLDGTAGTPDPALLGGLLSANDVAPVIDFFRSVPPDLHEELITH